MSQVHDIKENDSWLLRNYGSRRGFLRTIWHQLMCAFGQYDDLCKISWGDVRRIVFVCKGNICRSAYAEAVARSIGVDAVSCGLETVMDAPANEDAIKIARARGIEMGRHKTTPLMYLVVQKTDLLVTMEPWQARFLKKQLRRKHQCTLLGLWVSPALPHLQDPYGTNPSYFDKCFGYIQESVHELAKKIQ